MPLQLSSERKKDLAIIFIWLGAVLAYFLPELIRAQYLPHSLTWYGEAQHQWIPFWKYSANMLKRGLMPIWAEHFYCGFPYLAYPPNNLYYPPFYLLMYLSYVRAVYLESLVSFFLMGYFTYFCFRRMKLSPEASLAGMLAIVWGSFYIYYSTYGYSYRFWFYALNYWVLAGIIYQKRFRSLDFFLLILCYGLGASWDVEQIFYRAFFDLGWVIFSSPPGKKLRYGFLVVLAMGAGLFLLGNASLVNLFAYLSHSIRSAGVSFSMYRENSLPWQIVFSLLSPIQIPYISQIYPFYLGLSALILAGFGIKRLGRRAWLSIFAVVIYLLYILGEPCTLKIFYHLPVFNRTVLHYSAEIVIFIIFSGWVAWGFEKIQERLGTRKFFFIFVLLSFALLLLELIELQINKVRPLSLLDFSLMEAWKKALLWHGAKAPLLFLFFWVGIYLLKKPKNLGARKGFIILLLFLDFSLPALCQRAHFKKELFEPTPFLKVILKEPKLERFWISTKKGVKDTELVPLMGMQLDPLLPATHTPQAYWRVPVKRIAQILELVVPGIVRFNEKGQLENFNLPGLLLAKKFDPIKEKILSLMNVGKIISHQQEIDISWRKESRGEYRIYRNPHNLPRAWMAKELKKALSPQKELSFLQAPEFDPQATAIVPAKCPIKIKPENKSEVKIKAFRPGYWIFECEVGTRSSGFLVFSETYYPGWRAFIDGKEVRIWRTNFAFQGIEVPPGRHIIEFRFEPVAFKIGLWMSLVSYFLCILGIILSKGLFSRKV